MHFGGSVRRQPLLAPFRLQRAVRLLPRQLAFAIKPRAQRGRHVAERPPVAPERLVHAAERSLDVAADAEAAERLPAHVRALGQVHLLDRRTCPLARGPQHDVPRVLPSTREVAGEKECVVAHALARLSPAFELRLDLISKLVVDAGEAPHVARAHAPGQLADRGVRYEADRPPHAHE